jgi:hypothetical protein
MDDLQIYDVMYMDCPLWKRAAVRAMKLAGDVLSEAPETANHTNRVLWANTVLADPRVKVAEMRTHILLNATIAADPNGASSADIEFVISGLIDSFAKG